MIIYIIMVKILVFDTETTGLPPFQLFEENFPPLKNEQGEWESWDKYNSRISNLRADADKEKTNLEQNPGLWGQYKETWPYIVQLSYIMYDTDSNETIVKDIYIDLPSKFLEPDFLNKAHNITQIAIQEGLKVDRINIKDAINEFFTYFKNADVVTGHNVIFDINMLLAETTRTQQLDIFTEILESNKIYCTACKATNLVNICYEYNCKKEKPIFKMPKLNQAYFRMFGYAPNESALHNALIDVVACLRVFYRMWFQGIQLAPNNSVVPVCGIGEPDIYIELLKIQPDNPIIKIINDFTPPGINPEGVGSQGLSICPSIDNDEVESLMTGKPIQEIKAENQQKSRLARYKQITGLNPFKRKGGSRKNMKRNSRKRNSRKQSKKKYSRKHMKK